RFLILDPRFVEAVALRKALADLAQLVGVLLRDHGLGGEVLQGGLGEVLQGGLGEVAEGFLGLRGARQDPPGEEEGDGNHAQARQSLRHALRFSSLGQRLGRSHFTSHGSITQYAEASSTGGKRLACPCRSWTSTK